MVWPTVVVDMQFCYGSVDLFRIQIFTKGARQKTYRPSDSKIPSGEFIDLTTNRSEFDHRQGVRSSPIRPSSRNRLISGIIDTVTTTHADYHEKRAEK
ncbi:hypothetical protein KIN20_007696 [Parelaphostrongylus tenuis]|uniref:Uncharacterized protein n=1 Tax=Parelaphostrongylus tenuis TaxID=148309 RepID=A0AAD5QM70_PARTN|nr:hypothetical protein KIN20_007696 [Parelaphostrongylus tenuis]